MTSVESNDYCIIASKQFDKIVWQVDIILTIITCYSLRLVENDLIENSLDKKRENLNIINILKKRYNAPTLGTKKELTTKAVQKLKQVNPEFAKKLNFLLESESLSDFLNEINEIYDKLTITNKKKISKRYSKKVKIIFLDKFVNEIIQKRNKFKHDSELSHILLDYNIKINIKKWQDVSELLNNIIQELLGYKIFTKELLYIIPSNDEGNSINKNELNARFNTKVFLKNKIISQEEVTESLEYSDKTNAYIEIGQNQIELYPFIKIFNDKIYYYTHTINGYYYKNIQGDIETIKTKKKFFTTFFKLGTEGDKQSIFSEMIKPQKNPKTGITANLPEEEDTQIIGRDKQIRKIIDEIIEIPNENGIVYGPGGIGKTALMIELSRRIFNESENFLFSNIIWVKAKKNYYNPLLNITENLHIFFKTFEQILDYIFIFFSYNDFIDLELNEKKELIIEIIKENTILLIIDNLETIPKIEIEKIINFFNLEIKKQFKTDPNRFKVIITSREQIPCGYRQIRLKGLTEHSSIRLMDLLYKNYCSIKKALTVEKKKELYEISNGIPIIIKHCYGQIYEYNCPVDSIIKNLENKSDVIEFSFAEVIANIKKNKDQLDILLLLGYLNEPIQIEKISHILKTDIDCIFRNMQVLERFSCVERNYYENYEVYSVNNEIELLIKKLSNSNYERLSEIKELVIHDYTVDYQRYYSKKEKEIVEVFNDICRNGDYLGAKNYIFEKISKNTDSDFLKLHAAYFLYEKSDDASEAINLLDGIIKDKNRFDEEIYSLIIRCYLKQSFLDYSKIHMYIESLEQNAKKEETLYLVAQFYLDWSNMIRCKRKENDILKEYKRRNEYKAKAKKLIEILDLIKVRNFINHKYYYLRSNAKFNLWENQDAMNHIDVAIDIAKKNNENEQVQIYNAFKETIKRKILLYNSSK